MYWWLHPLANAQCEARIAAAEAYDDDDPGAADEVDTLFRRVYWETLLLGPRLLRVLDWLRDRNRRRILGLF